MQEGALFKNAWLLRIEGGDTWVPPLATHTSHFVAWLSPPFRVGSKGFLPVIPQVVKHQAAVLVIEGSQEGKGSEPNATRPTLSPAICAAIRARRSAPQSALSVQAYNLRIWRTSCEVPLIPPIHTPTAFAAVPLDAVSQLPEVQADGKST